MTLVVDFISVPLVFKSLASKEEAGKIGIKIFSRFNWFEVIYGIVLFVSAFLIKFHSPMKKNAYAVVAVTLFALSISYFYYITPTIVELSGQMHSLSAGQELEAVQKSHDFFHKLYVKLDTLKLILLLCGMGLLFEKGEQA